MTEPLVDPMVDPMLNVRDSEAVADSQRKARANWLRLHPDIEGTLAINPDGYSPITSKSRLTSLRYAVAGVLYMLKYGRNTQIQTVAAAVVFGVGLWAGLSPVEWSILILIITLNIVIEIVNGAVESAINLASQEIHPMARVGKDIAAGASLVAAIAAVLIGLLLLLPPVLEKALPAILSVFVR